MEDAISLGVGEPDFDTPWRVREEGIYSLERGRTFYTSNAGLRELKEEISRYLDRIIQTHYDPAGEVLVTVGGSEAIDVAFRAMLDAGDEVLIPQPSYVSYLPCAVLADGVPVTIPLQEKNDFRLTREELEAAITPRTKILVLPFPNNPTGAVMTKEDLAPIAEAVIGHDLYVVSDEIYAELTYGGAHCSIASPARHAGADSCHQRVLQGLCHDRLAARLRVRPGPDRGADDQDPPVRHHVRPHHQPVRGCGGAEKLRARRGADAGVLQPAAPVPHERLPEDGALLL